ncbi:MAG: TatD family hydrolase, partial [Bdellovibrionaceae bacterium]|nr:TatD family hydrolase [Pseudobdellovibrionaceae bacterium]
MYWIDTHAHISLFDDTALAALLVEGKNRKLEFWMMAGYDAKDWQRQESLVLEYPNNLASCFGLHPWRVLEMSQEEIASDLKLLKDYLPKAKALGETGIDKFKTKDPVLIKKQEVVFREHMNLNATF